MKIEYRGINKEEDRTYREAYITYDKTKEQEKANNTFSILHDMGWKVEEEECASIRIVDKFEYSSLVKDYKKAIKINK